MEIILRDDPHVRLDDLKNYSKGIVEFRNEYISTVRAGVRHTEAKRHT